MKTILRNLFLLPALLWGLHSQAVVRTDSLYSTVMDEWVKYNVYTPDSFDDSGLTAYPVLYLLHGLSDYYGAWNNNAQLGEVADELLAAGKICPMVIIMPNAGGPDTRNTWNGYFNMPGHSYEDFFFQELVPWVEARYHIQGDKAHRAISGLSMGGGGSTVYSQKHPEMFSSCYAMSAWLDNKSDNVRRPHQPEDKLDIVCRSVMEHSALDFIDNADEATIGKLRTVKWFFDCGDDDYLLVLSEQLHQKMLRARIKTEFRVRDGGHTWEYWHQALRLALPFASRNFEK